jgi:pimeloyl-ACP methyl ester carboxylesterase
MPAGSARLPRTSPNAPWSRTTLAEWLAAPDTSAGPTTPPEQNADDLHRIVEALGCGPVEMFANSGGAVGALALVTAHPGDLTLLVAHEPPLLALLPDADRAFAAQRAVRAV